VRGVRESQRIALMGGPPAPFDELRDLLFRGDIVLPHHPNGMRFTAFDSEGAILRQEIYCSGGGGFIEREGQPPAAGSDAVRRPYPFSSAAEMLAQGDAAGLPIWAMMLENEKALRGEAEIRERVARIWTVMQKSRSAGSPQTDCCRAVWTCGGAPLNCTANSWRRRTTIRCAPSTGSTCMPSR
jgi:L-serine dehydratase